MSGELLDVRVDGDEVDVGDARVDHPVERVQAGAADSDDADDGEVRARLGARRAVQARRGLGERLDRGSSTGLRRARCGLGGLVARALAGL